MDIADIVALGATDEGADSDDVAAGAAPARRTRLEALAGARRARLEKMRARRDETTRQQDHDHSVLAMSIPGCAAMARSKNKNSGAYVEAVSRLAFSPKVRGSGAAVEKVRKLQNLASAAVAKITLDGQAKGLSLMLGRDIGLGEGDWCVRGCSAMWDEAGQQTRCLQHAGKALGALSKAATCVQVFAGLAAVYEMIARANEEGDMVQVDMKIRWQPWVMAPMYLTSTSAPFLVKALSQTLPVNILDPSSVAQWVQGVFAAVFSLAFDSASSNLAAFAHFVWLTQRPALSDLPVLIHGQRCVTHQLNISRASCVSMAGFAGMLYSVSKMMRWGHASWALEKGIVAHIASRLEIRSGPAPDVSALRKAVRVMMQVDGDLSLLATKSGKGTTLARGLEEALQRCTFDRSSGAWVFYLPEGAQLARSPQEEQRLRDDAVASIAVPLLRLIIGRRWEVAALSRWTGVNKVTKRLTLGALFNNALPSTLQRLSVQMNLSEEKMKFEKDKLAEALGKGDDARQEWYQNASRVMRVSAFFAASGVGWKMGAVLITGSPVERLHWAILGSAKNKFRKATLTDLVDGRDGLIPKSMCHFKQLMDEWHARPEGPWHLLTLLGCGDMDDEGVAKWSRGLLLSAAVGVFRRMDLRHAAWPYKLQTLLSSNATISERERVVADLMGASPCCLDPFTLKFRRMFPDEMSMLGANAASVLYIFERELKFTTAPVECEHAATKSELSSRTSGVSQSVASSMAVCRHLHRAHVQRGGDAACLPLRSMACVDHLDIDKDNAHVLPMEDSMGAQVPALANGAVRRSGLEDPGEDEAEEVQGPVLT